MPRLTAPSRTLTIAVRKALLNGAQGVDAVRALLPPNLATKTPRAKIEAILSDTFALPTFSRCLPAQCLDYALTLPGAHLARIDSIDYEGHFEDNAPYWIYTRKGFRQGDNECHTLTAYDFQDFMNSIDAIVPCTCSDCL